MVKNIEKDTNENIEIVGKDTGSLKVEAVGYKVSYFIFSIFVSMIVIFFYHQGFQPIDIITIPILTLVIYFLMVYFAEIQSKKSKEEFITENYISHNESIPSVQDIMEQYKDKQKQEESSGEENQLTYTPAEEETHQPEEETHRRYPQPEEETHRRYPQPEEETHRRYPQPEEETHRRYPQPEEETHRRYPQPEEETTQVTEEEVKNNGKKQQFVDQKQKQITLMQKRKVPNLTNRSDQSVQPININVSYNNNRPLSINDFPSEKISLDDLKRKNNVNNYTFDPGLEGQYSQMPVNSFLPSAKKKTVSSPVNNFTQNLALADMNQGYYPQYLENPLNKNKNPTDILHILEESKSNKLNDIYSENNSDTVVNPEKWKNFFLGNESKDTICSQNQNAPCPVLLNNYWSEYKPIDDSR
jgi:hypothetical protein